MSRGKAAVILVAVTMAAAGCSGTGGESHAPGTIGSGAVPPTPAPGPVQVPVTGVPTPSGNLVTLAGQARSLETTAPLAGLTSVHLTGASELTGSGDVVDRTGRDLGSGTLRVVGTDVSVTGPGIQLSSRVRVQPGQVTVGATTLTLAGLSTISAAIMTFQPSPPPSPPPSSTAPGPTTTIPPPVQVSGPVRVQAGTFQITGTSLRLVDAPTDLHLTSSETDLSWAGTGAITTGAGPIQAGYLGVRAQQLDATVRRGPAAVDVRGTALALQVFANGVPQLRTPARFDVLSTHATSGFLGKRRAFVWTPRNLGSTYDMTILRIRPGNPAAGNVHIGLQPMPPMFGGDAHALVGADTRGLKSGDLIDSLIARNGDDKRTIGYDGPAGVNLVLIIEGNFDPIVVSVTTS